MHRASHVAVAVLVLGGVVGGIAGGVAGGVGATAYAFVVQISPGRSRGAESAEGGIVMRAHFYFCFVVCCLLSAVCVCFGLSVVCLS